MEEMMADMQAASRSLHHSSTEPFPKESRKEGGSLNDTLLFFPGQDARYRYRGNPEATPGDRHDATRRLKSHLLSFPRCALRPRDGLSTSVQSKVMELEGDVAAWQSRMAVSQRNHLIDHFDHTGNPNCRS